MKKVQYCIWNTENKEYDGTSEHAGCFWELFDTLEDAAGQGEGDPVDVYRIQPRFIGRFIRAYKSVRIKVRKPKAKKKKKAKK